jgi:hypothetical protein
MGCGCKNNQGQPTQQGSQTTQTTQNSSPTIQESIKKVVEKYYTKKS